MELEHLQSELNQLFEEMHEIELNALNLLPKESQELFQHSITRVQALRVLPAGKRCPHCNGRGTVDE